MRFGLFLMPEPFPWSNWTLSYDLKLDEIVKAERLTYDEVWVGEHHTGAYENIPAPDIFLLAAKKLGVEPNSCVVVEDSVAGVQAAIAGGMKCIGFTSAKRYEELSNALADDVISEFPDDAVSYFQSFVSVGDASEVSLVSLRAKTSRQVR